MTAASTILPVPELEDEQLPEPQRVVALAGQVFVDEAVDERRLEVAALARRRRPQHVGEEVAQAAAEPDAERHAEALLPAIEDLGRQQAPRRPP